MDLNSLKLDPLRPPAWRLDRVVRLINHRQEPQRPGCPDDQFIQVYRHLLLKLAAGGGDRKRQARVIGDYPDVYQAHRLHYSADLEQRQILEARLLTSETFAEIADRMATNAKVIEYFERLFFSVRDRFQHTGWIKIAAIRQRQRFYECRRSEQKYEQRGYLYRLFAYFGGPLVLDAVIAGMVATEIPRRQEDVQGWFTQALGQLVRMNGAAAAVMLEMNQKNMLQLIKLNLRPKSGPAKRREGSSLDFNEYAKQVCTTLEKQDPELWRRVTTTNK